MPTFELEIVTPEKTIYSGTVERLQAPGSDGSFGVLARHHPMLSALGIGRVSFLEAGGNRKRAAISGGFAEVQRDHVIVLAESAELAEEIDVARAEAARDRARERVARRRDPEVDMARAEAALDRALWRLRVAGQ